MPALPPSLLELVESGPLTHLTTINRDGSPQVSVVWLGLEDGELVTAHMSWYAKLRNIDRDPRVTLSFLAPRDPSAVLNPYAVLHARARIDAPSEAAWDLLDRLTKVYMGPDQTFPAPRGEGYVVRYAVERVGGVGPWAGT